MHDRWKASVAGLRRTTFADVLERHLLRMEAKRNAMEALRCKHQSSRL